MVRQLKYSLAVLIHTLLLSNSVYTQTLQVQASNNDQFTPAKIIQDYLLSEGVSIKKIAYAGNPLSVGYFKGGLKALGVDSGLVMSTGYVASSGITTGIEKTGKDFASWDNESTASFPDLSQLTQGHLQNITLLEITFIPYADTLSFRYYFASEEYPEFSCDDYNDVFGFFIEGPGYDQPSNIALIPGTRLPVTINTLHPPNPLIPGCDTLNFHLYIDNLHTNRQPVFDGLTRVFKAEAKVVPCQEYKIRLGLADVRDKIYDSAVFLEAKSFGTAPSLTLSGSEVLAEGCSPGFLKIEYPSPSRKEHDLKLRQIGSANQLDYELSPPLEKIPLVVQNLRMQLNILNDNDLEGIEYLQFEYQKDQCRTDTLTIQLMDNPLSSIITPSDTVFCQSVLDTLILNVNIQTITIPDYQVQYQWQSTLPLSCQTCDQIRLWPSHNDNISLQVKDNLGCTFMDSISINVIGQLPAPIATCNQEPDAWIRIEWSPVLGAIGYAVKLNDSGWRAPNGTYNHRFRPMQDSIIQIQLRALHPSIDCDGEPAILTCKNCPLPPVLDSIVIYNPSCAGGNDGTIQIHLSPYDFPVTFQLENISNNEKYFKGLKAGKYNLKISSSTRECPFLIEREVELNDPSPLTYNLITHEITCIGLDNGFIEVFPSGGLPPYEFSVNNQGWTKSSTFQDLGVGVYRLSVKDQAGCVIPKEVEVKINSREEGCLYLPTVFTPNGDHRNDAFFPQGDLKIEIDQFLIFDRWGDEIFARKNPFVNNQMDGWDGTFRGIPCNPGTYVWHIIFDPGDGQQKRLKGDVVLIR